jgi:hypothetical protein
VDKYADKSGRNRGKTPIAENEKPLQAQMASFFPSELGVRETMRLPNRKEATGARRLYRSTRVPDIVLRSNSATHRRTRFEIHEPVGEIGIRGGGVVHFGVLNQASGSCGMKRTGRSDNFQNPTFNVGDL